MAREETAAKLRGTILRNLCAHAEIDRGAGMAAVEFYLWGSPPEINREELLDVLRDYLRDHGSSPPPKVAITYPPLPTTAEPALKTDDADDPRFCRVCLDRERCTVPVPCGHVTSCITCVCAQKPTLCITCRAPLLMVIRKYE